MKEMSTLNFFKVYQTTYNCRIIDVREPYEYEENHIKGAINIPLTLLLEKHFLFINKAKHYFIICKNGSRSMTASKFLTELNYNVTNVVGGMDRWKGSVEKSTRRYY